MAEVNKISSFKSFSEIKAQENEMKLREENTLKKQETLVKIEEILDEMGLTSLSEIDEDKKQSLISKMFGSVSEDEGVVKTLEEGNAFIFAAAKAKQEGKEEFEFNGKKYKVTLKKDTGLKESFSLLITEGTRGFFGKIDKSGEISAVYTHYDSYPSNMLPIIKKSYQDVSAIDAIIAKGDNSGLESDINKMNFYGDKDSMKPLKGKVGNFIKFKESAVNSGAEFIYLYDERDNKWYMADYRAKELKPIIEAVQEGNAFGDAVRKAKEAGESEFEFDGETYKVEEHLDESKKPKVGDELIMVKNGKTGKVISLTSDLANVDFGNGDIYGITYRRIKGNKIEENLDEAISRSAFDRMDGLHNVKAMDALINAADTIFADLTEEMFEFSEIVDFIAMKLSKSKLAKTYESYDVTNEALSLEQKKVERFLNNLAKEFDYPIQDAARFVIATIKKMGLHESIVNEEIDIYNNLGKLMNELQVQLSNLKTSTKDAAWLKQLDLIESAFEKLEDRISIASKKLGMIPESTLTEARISASKILQEIIDGNTTRAEGIKISKELAAHFLTWIESSPFGKKNAGLPLPMLIKASFNWGIERGLDPKLKGELDTLKNSVKESLVNEAEIKSDDEFKEYAMTVLKKAFGAEFDEAKAEEVADGILKKADGDYGAAVGMLTSSLGESVVTEKFDANYWEDYHENSGKIEIFNDKQLQQEVSAHVEDWNDNNEDGEENEVTDAGEKKVLKLAKEFVKAKGWISSDVIDAMIAQES